MIFEGLFEENFKGKRIRREDGVFIRNEGESAICRVKIKC